MSFQPSVVEYFNNRKRPAVDDLNKFSNPSKVLVVDEAVIGFNDAGLPKPKNILVLNDLSKKIVYAKKETNILQAKKLKPSSISKTGQSSLSKGSKSTKSNGFQTDIRKSLFMTTKKTVEEKDRILLDGTTSETSKGEPLSTEQSNTDKPNVQFHMKGTLSPAKQERPELCENEQHEELKTELPLEHSVPEESKIDRDSSLKTPQHSTSISRKELNLGNIKAAMKSRISRMEEMKAALKRFNEKKAKLDEVQAKAAEPGKQDTRKIELEVFPSPLKTPTKMGHILSPQGKLTPSRLFATPPAPVQQSPLKSPAFQRYQALVTEGRPALVLPFKYRALAEVFRSVDTVASMFVNRKETVTLNKLRPAVQEMSRKNLTEYQLGQIKTVFPNAFDFSVEKCRIGCVEKYELVIQPLISGDSKEGSAMVMGPSVLLARRRTFFNALLELTKDHHEVFLRSLDPPMSIPRSRITRWHPEFLVDDVPDIMSAALPQPPNVERAATARDVLEKARSLFMVNPRMARALQRVSENNASPTMSNPSIPTTPPPITNKPALYGVPASILEKVRAKQAARALEAMTRTPAQAKEAVRLTRLPELARILRNLFVTEKKGVLAREMVLEKLSDSYRESLTTGELDDHLKLLADKTPGWVAFCNLRKTDYVKLCRNADMNRIMTRLEALAAEKCI